MTHILNIDTSTESAGIYLSADGQLVSSAVNHQQIDHASWLHKAIGGLLGDAGCTMQDLRAIGVTEGPGSYTGLRVAMASAKGFCFALDIPLITIGTLRLMAASALEAARHAAEPLLFCPLIDARRREVFTAVFDEGLIELMAPEAMILEPDSFSKWLVQSKTWFFGSGAAKWKEVCTHPHAVFNDVAISGNAFSELTYYAFLRGDFATLAYTEPVYLKEFYTHPKK